MPFGGGRTGERGAALRRRSGTFGTGYRPFGPTAAFSLAVVAINMGRERTHKVRSWLANSAAASVPRQPFLCFEPAHSLLRKRSASAEPVSMPVTGLRRQYLREYIVPVNRQNRATE